MTSKKVFISSDAFVSFINRAHPKHMHAAAFFRYFAQNHYQLYASVITINEVYDELSKTISPSIAKDFFRAIQFSNINILYPEESDMKISTKAILTNQSIELTFSKAMMTVLCNKRNIPQICTFEYLPSLFGLQVFYLPI